MPYVSVKPDKTLFVKNTCGQGLIARIEYKSSWDVAPLITPLSVMRLPNSSRSWSKRP